MSNMTTETLDKYQREFVSARKDYEAKKKESDEAHFHCEKAKASLIEALKMANKTSWDCDNYNVSISNKFTVTLPKTPEEKKAMLQYFRDQGPEIYLRMVGVNSMSLNSYYKEAMEENPDIKIPGVSLPSMVENLSLRSK